MSQEILFGVDYYPEHWNPCLWESDAVRMQAMGVKAVRLMEFAWAILEPQQGHFDFTLFDTVIELLARHGIAIVLGTPTATLPAWLYAKDPGLVQVSPDGGVKAFGTRRQACLNSPTYRSAALRITEQVAAHFGPNPNVVGWQIDNELGLEGSDRCVCANCRTAWHAWLAERYVSIATLNEAWGTVFWSTTYAEFSQVPQPRPQSGPPHNPALVLDYHRFCSDTCVRFVDEQAAIIRCCNRPEQWITTNTSIPPHGTVIDLRQVYENLDCAGLDYYPVWGDMNAPAPFYFTAYCLAFMRGLKPHGRFAVLEQISGFQGHACLGYLPSDKQIALWTTQAIAHGANKVFYFHWRTAPFGQEQLCSGILDPDNADTTRYTAIRDNIARHRQVYARLADSTMENRACLVYDKDNARLLRDQYQSKGMYLAPLPYLQVGYDAVMTRFYAPYMVFSIGADVQATDDVDLDRYKLVTLPLYLMADAAFVARLAAWVEQGGHLVLSWRTGIRDRRNQAVATELPGLFRDLAGIRIRRCESLNLTKVGLRSGVVFSRAEIWADILEPETARPIATYCDPRKHYRGAPAVTVNSYGRGKVYYLGTYPGPLGVFALFRRIYKDAGLEPRFAGIGLERLRRRTANGRTIEIVLNHTGMAWLVHGRKIAPFGTLFLDH